MNLFSRHYRNLWRCYSSRYFSGAEQILEKRNLRLCVYNNLSRPTLLNNFENIQSALTSKDNALIGETLVKISNSLLDNSIKMNDALANVLLTSLSRSVNRKYAKATHNIWQSLKPYVDINNEVFAVSCFKYLRNCGLHSELIDFYRVFRSRVNVSGSDNALFIKVISEICVGYLNGPCEENIGEFVLELGDDVVNSGNITKFSRSSVNSLLLVAARYCTFEQFEELLAKIVGNATDIEPYANLVALLKKKDISNGLSTAKKLLKDRISDENLLFSGIFLFESTVSKRATAKDCVQYLDSFVQWQKSHQYLEKSLRLPAVYGITLSVIEHIVLLDKKNRLNDSAITAVIKAYHAICRRLEYVFPLPPSNFIVRLSSIASKLGDHSVFELFPILYNSNVPYEDTSHAKVYCDLMLPYCTALSVTREDVFRGGNCLVFASSLAKQGAWKHLLSFCERYSYVSAPEDVGFRQCVVYCAATLLLSGENERCQAFVRALAVRKLSLTCEEVVTAMHELIDSRTGFLTSSFNRNSPLYEFIQIPNDDCKKLVELYIN